MASDTKLSTAKIDRVFELEAAMHGAPATFDLCLRAAGAPDALEDCPGLVATHADGGLTWLTFDHGYSDALGALASLRGLASGRPAPRVGELVDEPDTDKPPPRRALIRLRSPHARLCSGAADEPNAVLFAIDSDAGVSRDSTTERIVAASHTVALGRSPEGACSTILVSVTSQPWSPERPANNCSSAFFSVVSTAERDAVAFHVRNEFAAARRSRHALMRRMEAVGSIPRRAWPLVTRVGRLTDADGAATAVVSSLGTVDDEALAGLGSDWGFVPPVRSPACLSVGVVKVNGRRTATVAGFDPRDRLAELGRQILATAGHHAERLF